MKRRPRAILGTVLLVLTVSLSYAAANNVAPELTFPLFILAAFACIINGVYHASRS